MISMTCTSSCCCLIQLSLNALLWLPVKGCFSLIIIIIMLLYTITVIYRRNEMFLVRQNVTIQKSNQSSRPHLFPKKFKL